MAQDKQRIEPEVNMSAEAGAEGDAPVNKVKLSDLSVEDLVPGLEEEIAGLVYPDRRGSGYGLSRHNDHPKLEFTRIDGEEDVHFAHARGFVAKTTATEVERLKELVMMAWG